MISKYTITEAVKKNLDQKQKTKYWLLLLLCLQEMTKQSHAKTHPKHHTAHLKTLNRLINNQSCFLHCLSILPLYI